MYSTGDIARWIDVKLPTIHRWTNRYASVLSDSATPDKSVDRRYTDEDVTIFWTIHVMRESGISHGDILDRLLRGERIEPAALPDDHEIVQVIPSSPEAVIAKIKEQLVEREAEIVELKRNNDRLQGALDTALKELETQRNQLFELVLKLTSKDNS